jgi:hypothetical protein
MQSKFIKFSSILIILLSFSTHANDLTLNLSGNTSTLNIIQDGQDNDIDMTANSFVGGTLIIQQLNNNNDIDVTVTAGSGSGSWLTIYQNGSDSYNANLSCGHSWCGMTVDQR